MIEIRCSKCGNRNLNLDIRVIENCIVLYITCPKCNTKSAVIPISDCTDVRNILKYYQKHEVR